MANLKTLSPRLLSMAMICVSATTFVAQPAVAGGRGSAVEAKVDSNEVIAQLRQQVIGLHDRVAKLESTNRSQAASDLAVGSKLEHVASRK